MFSSAERVNNGQQLALLTTTGQWAACPLLAGPVNNGIEDAGWRGVGVVCACQVRVPPPPSIPPCHHPGYCVAV